MATFRKRGGRWQAQVKIAGKLKAKTHDTKAQAIKWADMIERGPQHSATLAEALERYREEVSPKKRGARWERLRIDLILRTWPAVHKALAAITPADIADWRDNRLMEVSASSVRREMTLLSHVFNTAVREWGWIDVNPMSRVSRPESAPPRSRAFSQDEIERICLALGWAEETPQSVSQRVAVAFLLALETAMRSSEILGLQWEHVREKSVHLPMTKNGTSRDVPLSKRARALVKLCEGLDENVVIPLNKRTRDTLFRRARVRAGVDDATFHDARRTATIRLAEKLEPMELAKVTGHRDLRMLLNVYYGIQAEDLADKLG